MKNLLFTLIAATFSTVALAQNNTYQLSSHILDISKGQPAVGVTIQLEKYDDQTEEWIRIEEKVTDNNGRISDFLPSEEGNEGMYKLIYLTSSYFNKSNTESFYPFIEVVFIIKDKKHYHVPITLSAYGYSTYRGN